MTKNKHADQPPQDPAQNPAQAPAQAPVSHDAAQPETSNPRPESSEDKDEERHNAPHADDYDRLAEVRNDRKD